MTDLLIRDLRIHDATHTMKTPYLKIYEIFVNEECKVRFKFNQDRDSKEIKYHDLTGPEKFRLFKNINIPLIFPDLHNKDNIQHLWKTFFKLINDINEGTCNAADLDVKAKAWVTSFTSTYQAKDVRGVGSGPAGPILAGPLFTIIYQGENKIPFCKK